MKKIISLGLVLSLCILLTGCGKVVKCSSKSPQKNYDISTDYTIKASGDIVTSVTIKQVIESKDKKVLENFKKQLEEQYKSNNTVYGGYKYKVKMKR